MRVSELTTSDYVLLNATWTNQTNKAFQCKQNEEVLKVRKDYELALKFVRTKKGCGTISKDVKIELDGFGYYSCLCHQNFQHPIFNTLLTIHQQYENGILPFSGGLLDQPSQIIEMLNFISKLKLDNEIEQRKENERNNKKTRPSSKVTPK